MSWRWSVSRCRQRAQDATRAVGSVADGLRHHPNPGLELPYPVPDPDGDRPVGSVGTGTTFARCPADGGENREAGVNPARARRGNRGAATQARKRSHWPSGWEGGWIGIDPEVRRPASRFADRPSGWSRRSGSLPMSSDIYDVIHRRRDVRAQFTGAPVAQETLRRVLAAAHAAPSVGLSQPWDFVIVRDKAVRAAFHAHVQQERAVFAATLQGEAADRFAGIKVDGVLESSLSIVVTYDPQRGAPAVLGRHAIADAGLYSVCFYREAHLRDLLGIPEHIRPVAWLCLGPVSHLAATPDLERHGWRTRQPMDAVLHHDRWVSR